MTSRLFIAAVLALGASAAAAPEDLGVSFEGSTRWRYETLSAQFRADGSGSDQAISGRTFLHGRYRSQGWTLGVELIDSRVYLNDPGSPTSTSFVNTADILQAYVETQLGATQVRAGRITLDSGSRRFIARNNFRNTRNAFTGIETNTDFGGGQTLQLMALAPVVRRPGDADSLLDNEAEFDREAETQRFYGAVFASEADERRPRFEAFVYLLDDGASDQTGAARTLYTPGGRVFRAPAPGAADYEWETALQFGERGDLDVFGHTHHAHVGYTFDAPWRPRLALEIEHASGDDDAADGSFNEYDRLFGLRRTDFGETGIAGPFRRQNITSFGARAQVREGRADARLNVKAHWLASPTGVWGGAGVRDAAGESGQFIGVYLSGRARYRLVPDRLELEAGGGWLARGRFAKTAPNAGTDEDPLYAFLMTTLRF